MNDYSTESPKPVWSHHHHQWSYSPTSEQVPQAVDREAQWKQFDNSVNAVSFGFVATAILISMFLVMAIFERFLRPRSSSYSRGNRALFSSQSRARMRLLDKLEQPSNVSSSSNAGVSVVMPGQNIPTFIAHPVPLPCSREGISWPSHDHRVPGYFMQSCKVPPVKTQSLHHASTARAKSNATVSASTST